MRKAVMSYEMRMKAIVLTFIAIILSCMVLIASTTVTYADDGSSLAANAAATQVDDTVRDIPETAA